MTPACSSFCRVLVVKVELKLPMHFRIINWQLAYLAGTATGARLATLALSKYRQSLFLQAYELQIVDRSYIQEQPCILMK
jgi:hypothetical protein